MKQKRMPAEWEAQSKVQLTWPHDPNIWGEDFKEVQQCFLKMAKEIAKRQNLLIVAKDIVAFKNEFPNLITPSVTLAEANSNDSWTRDHAPITIFEEGVAKLIKFTFNGWGLRFPANHDNQIAYKLHKEKFYGDIEMINLPFVLEGGSVESDGEGTLMATTECLGSRNRNEHYSKSLIESRLKQWLGLKKVLWVEHGALLGDDTDSHIDILARFAPNKQLLYIQCTDPKDPHYESLKWMESQLKNFTNAKGHHFELLPLPLPHVADKKGQRLAASYANFLIINEAVLAPIYGQPEDQAAIATLEKAFSDRQIVPINCKALISQGGSLHCTTMQFPA